MGNEKDENKRASQTQGGENDEQLNIGCDTVLILVVKVTQLRKLEKNGLPTSIVW